MSTAYYQETVSSNGKISASLLGVETFEKQGAEKPRKVFTWAVNPASYLWEAGFHTVVDEHQNHMDRSTFVLKIVGSCSVQRYDTLNIPA